METASAHTKRILKKYTLKAKKSLGQNFLASDAVLADIVAGSGLQKGETVLEVGPGTGALTRELAKVAGKVWAVELDNTLSQVLQEEFAGYENVEIIQADALQFNIASLNLPREAKLRIIANLPYYITSPLINHFLNQREYLHSMTIMVQEEVARRIVAVPGSKDYGILSIAVQVFCQGKILFTVPPQAFLPPPKITSAIVKLEIMPESSISAEEEQRFFRVVKAAFGQRRKTLLNSLSQGLNIPREDLAEVLRKAGIDPGVRAETLAIENFQRICQFL